MHLPEKLLTITLIQLAHDITDGIFQLGDNDMLNGVDTSVRGLDDLIQDNKGRLKGC